jgi:hypothetical protein
VAFGFAPPTNVSQPASADSAARLSRMLEPAEWASAGIPLLRNPREVVAALYERHRPEPSTAVVAVLDPQERLAASASFSGPSVAPDGWQFRNVLLAHLRRVIPHDLRLRVPVRTAVLLYCREGDVRWTESDGAWMWGLRDACTLHGLRCGAYITLTRDRWQVLGEDRGGRRPQTSAAAHPSLRAPVAETRNGPRAQKRAERRAETRRGESRRAESRPGGSQAAELRRNESPRRETNHSEAGRRETDRTETAHADRTERKERAEPGQAVRTAPGRTGAPSVVSPRSAEKPVLSPPRPAVPPGPSEQRIPAARSGGSGHSGATESTETAGHPATEGSPPSPAEPRRAGGHAAPQPAGAGTSEVRRHTADR